MKIISNTICLSVFSLVCPAIPFASLPSAYASLVDTSQNQTFESEPAHSFKLAAVHFITNDNALNFGNQEFLPDDLCKQGGYTHNGCPSGYVKGEPCPYDSKFVKDCIDPDTWCKNNGYNVASCSVPKYPTTPCPYKSSLYKSCETDNIRACKELGYSLTCETGKVGGDSCPYNSSYKKCICNPCSGYGYTAAQASAQGYVPGEVCNSCGTVKYKRSENKCDGYKACDCGGEAGAKVCYSGSVQKFSSCLSCSKCESAYQYTKSNCSGTLYGWECEGKYAGCAEDNMYILYSDRTTSYNMVAGKKPIGLVIDPVNRLAMALEFSPYLKWQDSATNQLINIPEILDATGVAEYGKPYCAYYADCADGKAYTNAILAMGKSKGISFPAAEYARNYQPTACAAGSWCGKGNWFLPSINQIQRFGSQSNYNPLHNYGNEEAVMHTLEKIGYSYNQYSLFMRSFWTSNEKDTQAAKTTSPGTYGTMFWDAGSTMKNEGGYVAALPVINY